MYKQDPLLPCHSFPFEKIGKNLLCFQGIFKLSWLDMLKQGRNTKEVGPYLSIHVRCSFE